MQPTVYPPLVQSGITDATGRCEVAFPGRNAGRVTITQISPEMSSAGAAAASCSARRNGALVCPLVPFGDAAGGDPPVDLWPTDVCSVVWLGAVPGAIGTVTFFYVVRSA